MSTQLSNFIHALFEAQLNIKLYHWSTSSYARHKAADALLDKLQENGDKFVEVFVGKYGRDKISLSKKHVAIQNLNDTSVCKFLDDYIKLLCNEVPKYVNKSDTDLLNIRDELLAACNQTKYLFGLE
jgi:hypothetical protein